eukprot:7068210-Ditylum_brightwellii.AAC.1
MTIPPSLFHHMLHERKTTLWCGRNSIEVKSALVHNKNTPTSAWACSTNYLSSLSAGNKFPSTWVRYKRNPSFIEVWQKLQPPLHANMAK